MDWNKRLQKLYQKKRNYPDLSIMVDALEKLKNPQLDYPTVHIAGTNGKGSVANFMARALQKSGYKVGLYTSPHLKDFKERIQINGVMISQTEAEIGIERILKLSDELSFFEITTLLSFVYFQKEKVNIAIIETGLGGKYDATNVLKPLVSVITSIGYDHQAYLGNSLEKIAMEKAGIIHKDVLVVAGPSCRYPCIEKAKQVIFAEKQPSTCQENQQVAKLALQNLKGFNLPVDVIDEALRTSIAGRLECYLVHEKVVVFDLAHNVSAFERLMQELPFENFDLLFSMSFDKDIKACLELMKSRISNIHLIKMNDRSMHLDLMHQEAKKVGIEKVDMHHTLQGAMLSAMESSQPLLICGSFYLVGPARAFFFDQYQNRAKSCARLLDLERFKAARV